MASKFASLAVASIIILGGAPVQCASPGEYNEIGEARMLQEAGMSFLEAEEIIKARKAAIVRAAEKADKAQAARAGSKDEKTRKK